MVIDMLAALGDYASLNARFAKAAAYLQTVDLDSLAEGRYEIDGSDVFMTIVETALREETAAPLEAHDRYADVQIVICGTERFGWKNRGRCKPDKDGYRSDRDIVFFTDRPSCFLTLSAGEMAVFFPSDAHAPLIGEGTVRKCIVKVRV